MPPKPGKAAWRTVMTDQERAELARAEHDHAVANVVLRQVAARLKHRCIKRLKRPDGKPE